MGLDEFHIKELSPADTIKFPLDSAKSFFESMMEYRCALMEVETKLNVLNQEFALRYNRNPFESIKSRIKSSESIFQKLQRRNLPLSVQSMESNLFDIAGIRVICSFPDDIYTIAGLLLQQDDIMLIESKDYIKNPKDNGYRSLHLILQVPIFLAEQKKWIKLEVQFRTIAMDFWASLEHTMKYKKNVPDADEIYSELKDCADIISSMDTRMQQLRTRIEVKEHDKGRIAQA